MWCHMQGHAVSHAGSCSVTCSVTCRVMQCHMQGHVVSHVRGHAVSQFSSHEQLLNNSESVKLIREGAILNFLSIVYHLVSNNINFVW